MIITILHLISCIALVAASAYWGHNASEGHSIYRHMLPFIAATVVFGLAIIYQYAMEFFVASYSGAMYEVEGLSHGVIAWISTSILFMLIPLLAFIPYIGRHTTALILIGILAAVPSIGSFVPKTSKIQGEQAAPRNR
jgi:hypothetical protein